MNRSYEFGFIDGSIILRRNLSSMQGWLLKSKKYGQEMVVKSVLQSIFKIQRDFLKCERYFILWDKKPYHKEKIIKDITKKESEYKADRAKLSDRYLELMGSAKLAIMTYLSDIGITSVQFPGWEADDLAYLASLQVLGRSKKSVIISYDSDWYYWVDDNTDYYNINQNTCYSKSTIISLHPNVKGCDLFMSKAIRDSLRGSHNNLKNILKPDYQSIKCRDVLEMIAADDYSFTDNPDLFKAQYATFDFTTYPDYNKASQFLSYYLTRGKLGSLEDFHRVLKSVGLKVDKYEGDKVIKSGSIGDHNYIKFKDSLNPELWL